MGLHVGQCYVHRRTPSGGLRKRSDAALSVYAPFSGSALRFTLDKLRKGTCHHPPGQRWRCDSDLTGKVPLSCPLTAGTIGILPLTAATPSRFSGRVRHKKRRPLLPVSAGQTLCVSLYFDGYTAMQSAVLITGPLSRGYFFLRRPDAQRSAAPATSKATNWFLFFLATSIF